MFQNCSPVQITDVSSDVGDLGGDDGVPKKFVAKSQAFNVSNNPEVDILFIVDNSGSMEQEQVNMSSKINGFVQLISNAGLQWNIALTTTDGKTQTKDAAGNSRAWGDGQFRPFDSDTGSLFVLKHNQHTVADAQAKLAQAILVGIKGDGNERGINNTFRAIERISDTQGSQQFFRPSANLVVILISDEDECSTGNCSSVSGANRSKPENLLNLVQTNFNSGKVFVFNSIIRAVNNSACSTAANKAPTYEKMSQMTGGIVGSICASDYTSILSSLGQSTAALVKSVNLNCPAVDGNADGKVDFVLKNESTGQLISSGYTVSGKTVTFGSTLAEGRYSAAYTCLE